MKIRFLQHIFAIYTEQGNKEGLVILNRKLLKLSRGNELKQPDPPKTATKTLPLMESEPAKEEEVKELLSKDTPK